ncbi:MAG: family 16 glycosylhydrolase [Minicystis sp.]
MNRNLASAPLALMFLAACGVAGETAEDDADTRTDAVTSIPEGDYVLQAVHSGKCVDVSAAGTANGTRVQQWTCNGTVAQVWRFKAVDNGIYEIENPHAGKALDVRDVRTDNGAPLQIWQFGNGANQHFLLDSKGNGEYVIRARHSWRVLDVDAWSTADGATIQQWDEHGGGNQRFRLIKQGGGGGNPNPNPTPSGWHLVWSDEFNGPDGSAVDGSKWKHDIGGGGWGNGELEYYTDGTENARLEGGNLVITATPAGASKYGCWYGACQYSSARLLTAGKFDVTYGRVEARIQIPRGQGIWPAFWMLGNNIGNVGWPSCGEIDIMENIGKEPSTVHGSLHGPGYSGGNPLTGWTSLPGGAKLADGFHTYAVEWDPGVVRFYLDNTLYETRTSGDVPGGAKWVYDHPFFLILNVAVGGGWPGSPDGSTSFPQQMKVDYVRVYKRN